MSDEFLIKLAREQQRMQRAQRQASARAPGGAAVLDYDKVSATTSTTTTSTSMTDLNSMSISVTVSQNALIVLFGSCDLSPASGQNVGCVITDNSNNLLGMSQFAYLSSGTLYAPTFVCALSPVASGTHTFKIRWVVSGGTGTCGNRELTAIALAR